MPSNDRYEELAAAIVKAVEALDDREHYIAKDGRIWLEDVLRAILISPHGSDIGIKCDGWFQVPLSRSMQSAKWHLGKDLAWHRAHAPETIAFLYSLLCQ